MKKIVVVFCLISSLLFIIGCTSNRETEKIASETKLEKEEVRPENVEIKLDEKKLAAFWRWVSEHEDKIYNYDRDPDNEATRIQLSSKLESFDPDLTFMIGPLREGKRDFIISADGILTAFPYVKRIVEKASGVDKLNVIAFRPRTEITEVKYRNITLKSEQVYFRWEEEEGGKIGIETFVSGVNEMNDDIESALFLLMDNAIGEYEVETRVGGISYNLYKEKEKDLLPFHQFRTIVDENYNK
ncbi:hypothetical protein PaecuDRAFT_4274 [Paenibacillus curdlanolyticus YK9]|uniref:Lipoprotein n=1 Tax=Paenibacillus curdlanolyticus YK9 TaxID=717606 RepID=E0IF33_9BACL|nr:hypothetical protein [Paenibacillus curdlanolyticus]EFM08809.1 hypothetical protein PaecuDRAFT_4274 [Paenibacillus curdlanolyticus YK9]